MVLALAVGVLPVAENINMPNYEVPHYKETLYNGLNVSTKTIMGHISPFITSYAWLCDAAVQAGNIFKEGSQ